MRGDGARDQSGRLESQLRVQTGAEQVVVASTSRDGHQATRRTDSSAPAASSFRAEPGHRRSRRTRNRSSVRGSTCAAGSRACPGRDRQDLLVEIVDDVAVIAREPRNELVPVRAVAQRQTRRDRRPPASHRHADAARPRPASASPRPSSPLSSAPPPRARTAARRQRPRRADRGREGGDLKRRLRPVATARRREPGGNRAAAASRRGPHLPRSGGSRRARVTSGARTPRARRSEPEPSRRPGRHRAPAAAASDRVPSSRPHGGECLERVGPETDRIAVGGVERDPGELAPSLSALAPLRAERDFPHPAGAGSVRALHRCAGQPGDQRVASDPVARIGDLKLGRKQWRLRLRRHGPSVVRTRSQRSRG